MHRSFMATVADIRNGRLQDELTKEYGAALDAVKLTGKGAKITLTLNIKPLDADGTMHQVTDQITSVLPKPAIAPTLFYVHGEAGDFSHSQDAPGKADDGKLKSVPANAPVLKDANNG